MFDKIASLRVSIRMVILALDDVLQISKMQISVNHVAFQFKTRVEVWRWLFERNAFKWCKKIIFIEYFVNLFAVNAVSWGELFIFNAFSDLTKKKLAYRDWKTNSVNFCMKCGQFSGEFFYWMPWNALNYFFFHRFSDNNLHQKSMRWFL